MTRLALAVVLLLASLGTASAGCAWVLWESPSPETADCAWVLWVEAPMGSDQWSVAHIPQSRFSVREECQRHADDLNAFDLTMAKGEFAAGATHDVFTCFPCTVDPRPEGALLYESAVPPGLKGK